MGKIEANTDFSVLPCYMNAACFVQYLHTMAPSVWTAPYLKTTSSCSMHDRAVIDRTDDDVHPSCSRMLARRVDGQVGHPNCRSSIRLIDPSPFPIYRTYAPHTCLVQMGASSLNARHCPEIRLAGSANDEWSFFAFAEPTASIARACHTRPSPTTSAISGISPKYARNGQHPRDKQ